MDTIKKHFIPNAGTLIILGLFLIVQTALAKQPTTSAAPLSITNQSASLAPLVTTDQAASFAPAATTNQLSYQGILTDQNGVPINGNVEMVFNLYHVASGGTAFWTESHTGANAVSVVNGQFHVLLGGLSALNPANLTGDLYLGITVSGEEMLPRENFTKVVNAVYAERSQEDFSVAGALNVGTPGVSEGGEIRLAPGSSGDSWGIDNFFGTFRLFHGIYSYFHVYPDGSVLVGAPGVGEGGEITLAQGSSGNNWTIDNIYGTLRVQHDGLQYLAFDAGGNLNIVGSLNLAEGGISMGSDTALMRQDDVRILHLLPYGGSGHPWDSVCIGCGSSANLRVVGNVTCGGLTEANLQTPEEQNAQKIDRFEQGDILCWSNDRLEKCSAANDRLIQAVADSNGKPIVIGAEVIKIIGPVKAGDLLVASDIPGYAMVNNNPLPGTVIAQALEDFNGLQGLIKAMIRKF